MEESTETHQLGSFLQGKYSVSFVWQVLYSLISLLAKRGVALPISMPFAPMDVMRLSSSTALEATEVTLAFLSQSILLLSSPLTRVTWRVKSWRWRN